MLNASGIKVKGNSGYRVLDVRPELHKQGWANNRFVKEVERRENRRFVVCCGRGLPEKPGWVPCVAQLHGRS